jgi:hypothetical protein
MATHRPFRYNPFPNPTINDTEQVGDIAAGLTSPIIDAGGEWWNGPDEEIGYVIAYLDPTGNHPNGPEDYYMTNYVCHLGFLRTGTHSESEFIELSRKVTGNNSISSGVSAKTELNNLGYWTSYKTPILSLDAGDLNSYPGSGTIWTDTVGGLTFSLINGPTYDTNFGGSIFFLAGLGVGQSDYAESQTSLPSMSEYTISVWHKFYNSVNTLPAIITEIQSGSGPINYKLGKIDANKDLQAGYYTNSWNRTNINPDTVDWVNVWSHLTMTVDSNQNLKLYVNKKLVQSLTFSGEIPTSSGQGIRLMRNHGIAEENWGGHLAKVDIWNKALSHGEISSIYNYNINRFLYNSVVSSGLVLNLDAGTPSSYAGSGVNWYDLVNNNDATLINNPTYGASYSGYLNFDDGSNQYATTPNLGNLPEWSVEVWFRLNTPLTGKISSIVSNVWDGSTSLNFSIGTNNSPVNYNLCVGFFDGTWRNTNGFTPNTNQWYQVIGTYDGTTIRQYVNGTASGGTLTYTGTPTSGGENRLMRRWDSPLESGNLMDGDLQIVRIYNRAISAQEVEHNYNMVYSRFI